MKKKKSVAINSEGSLTHSIVTVKMKLMNESFMKMLEIMITLSENVQFVKEDTQTQKSKTEQQSHVSGQYSKNIQFLKLTHTPQDCNLCTVFHVTVTNVTS